MLRPRISNDERDRLHFHPQRDLDIYTMDADGIERKAMTHELGYDGGPSSRPTATLMVYRAHHPQTEQRSATTKTCSSKPSSARRIWKSG